MPFSLLLFICVAMWCPLKVPVFGKISPRTACIKSNVGGRVLEYPLHNTCRWLYPMLLLNYIEFMQIQWFIWRTRMPNIMSVLCDEGRRLALRGCLWASWHIHLAPHEAAVVRLGWRRAGAAATRPRPAAGLEMTCAQSVWGSQHRVLAGNDHLCGQLASQLAE